MPPTLSTRRGAFSFGRDGGFGHTPSPRPEDNSSLYTCGKVLGGDGTSPLWAQARPGLCGNQILATASAGRRPRRRSTSSAATHFRPARHDGRPSAGENVRKPACHGSSGRPAVVATTWNGPPTGADESFRRSSARRDPHGRRTRR